VSFRKPFRAVPLKITAQQRRRNLARASGATARFLAIAAAAGVAVGIGSLTLSDQGRTTLSQSGTQLAVSAGIARARQPQPGDYWTRCAEARAAGSAPIYAGEPGYRDGLDGDDDGIACEPYRGQ
jgi:hypothetical protein